MSTPEEEIQKTLEELKKRTEAFQAGGVYSSPSSGGFSMSSNTKLILALAGVFVVLVISAIFYIERSGSKAEIKAPPGQKVIYPKDGPPRLSPKI